MSLACNVGYNARLYGYAKLKDCPYLKGTFLYNEWTYGWMLCDEKMNKGVCVMNYEQIAREAGFNVLTWTLHFWISPCKKHTSKYSYGTQQEAWKACCVENGLVDEGGA